MRPEHCAGAAHEIAAAAMVLHDDGQMAAHSNCMCDARFAPPSLLPGYTPARHDAASAAAPLSQDRMKVDVPGDSWQPDHLMRVPLPVVATLLLLRGAAPVIRSDMPHAPPAAVPCQHDSVTVAPVEAPHSTGHRPRDQAGGRPDTQYTTTGTKGLLSIRSWTQLKKEKSESKGDGIQIEKAA